MEVHTMEAEENGGLFKKKAPVLGQIKEPVQEGVLEKLIDFSTGLAQRQNYSSERISEMTNTLKEVFFNIINYAFSDTDGDIEIVCTLDRAQRMVFKIIDWGNPFNMLLASDPLFREEWTAMGKTQPSTRLVKKLADTVEYQRLENMNYFFVTFSPVVKSHS